MITRFSALLLTLAAWAQGVPAPSSPAEQKIESARKSIELRPKLVQGYVDLAQAFVRRARETSDPEYYKHAEAALKTATQIEPANFMAAKLELSILLGRREFARALDKAVALNKKVPDDVLTYGLLADAYIALGKYKEAEKATQWMLDLRSGNIPALTRTACLRELFGDPEGAVEALNMAARSTPPSEIEDRAWLLVQVGNLRLMQGRIADAGRSLEQALAVFPNYPLALGNLARVRVAEKHYEDAMRLLQQQYAAAPAASILFALGEAMNKAGRQEESKSTFLKFEMQARADVNLPINSNHELVLYYADYANLPAEALRIANIEIARRQDVRTVDAYAWALHTAGDDSEARKNIEHALEVGIQDPEMFYHAGAIAMKQGDSVAAERYLTKAMVLPTFAESSRKLLAQATL